MAAENKPAGADRAPSSRSGASTGQGGEPSRATVKSSGSRLWLWVGAAFLLQLGAWAAWLMIASRHKVEEVPVVRTP